MDQNDSYQFRAELDYNNQETDASATVSSSPYNETNEFKANSLYEQSTSAANATPQENPYFPEPTAAFEQETGMAASALSGPSHAEEVGRGIPTTIVVGSKKKETAEYLQNLFMKHKVLSLIQRQGLMFKQSVYTNISASFSMLLVFSIFTLALRMAL